MRTIARSPSMPTWAKYRTEDIDYAVAYHAQMPHLHRSYTMWESCGAMLRNPPPRPIRINGKFADCIARIID